MKQVMCIGCGEFVLAIPERGELVPAGENRCPKCGGTEFEQVRG